MNLTNSDILTIYDGDELTARILGQYVGSSGPQKLYSSSPDLTIQFHSDPAGLIFGKGQGFIMNYIGKGAAGHWARHHRVRLLQAGSARGQRYFGPT